ncbi:MAG: hypothetical protein CL675_11245 [Bdellovibrionaceae bacterium]|nr:hypothetical protein [Pseudobdellovibrionaceae bacterium]
MAERKYQLQSGDKSSLRFAQIKKGARAVRTEFLSVSTTTVEMKMESREAPKILERIKIEVPIPGSKQIAWWALVSNVVPAGGSSVIVTCDFDDLPRGHLNSIKQGLASKSRAHRMEQMSESTQQAVEALVYLPTKPWMFVFYGLFALWLIYLLIQPPLKHRDGEASKKAFDKGVENLFMHRYKGAVEPDRN